MAKPDAFLLELSIVLTNKLKDQLHYASLIDESHNQQETDILLAIKQAETNNLEDLKLIFDNHIQ